MKKIGSIRLALSFAGCFLGAGYVSGQEVWQFFGSFGRDGVFGLLLALALLALIGYATMRMVRCTYSTETDRIILGDRMPPLRWVITALETVFLFGVCMIMAAGVGALCDQLLSVPAWIGCAVFVLLVTLVALKGVRGMVAAFSATVPILACATLLFGLHTLLRNGFTLPAHSVSGSRGALLQTWPLAAISFASYNIFGSIAILSPLGTHVRSNRALPCGILIGTVILLISAVSVMICVASAGTHGDELPMLSMALTFGRIPGLIYGFLLFLAMFGTCLSCFVAFVRTVCEKSVSAAKHLTGFHICCAVVIFFGSLLGFGDLIGVVYPIVGYCSSIFILILLVRWLRFEKRTLSARRAKKG